MEVLIAFLSIIWSILCLILFFKIWGATNDIAEMKDMMHSFLNNYTNSNRPSQQPVGTVQQSASEVSKKETPTPKIEDLGLRPGDYIVRNFDNKEYKIEEVRPNGVLVYIGMMAGYRTLTPDQFTVVKSSGIKR